MPVSVGKGKRTIMDGEIPYTVDILSQTSWAWLYGMLALIITLQLVVVVALALVIMLKVSETNPQLQMTNVTILLLLRQIIPKANTDNDEILWKAFWCTLQRSRDQEGDDKAPIDDTYYIRSNVSSHEDQESNDKELVNHTLEIDSIAFQKNEEERDEELMVQKEGETQEQRKLEELKVVKSPKRKQIRRRKSASAVPSDMPQGNGYKTEEEEISEARGETTDYNSGKCENIQICDSWLMNAEEDKTYYNKKSLLVTGHQMFAAMFWLSMAIKEHNYCPDKELAVTGMRVFLIENTAMPTNNDSTFTWKENPTDDPKTITLCTGQLVTYETYMQHAN